MPAGFCIGLTLLAVQAHSSFHVNCTNSTYLSIHSLTVEDDTLYVYSFLSECVASTSAVVAMVAAYQIWEMLPPETLQILSTRRTFRKEHRDLYSRRLADVP